MMRETTASPTVSRRTLSRGAAWAVPAVAVAAAAPAVAASGPSIYNAGYVSSKWGSSTSCGGTTVSVNGTSTAATSNPGFTVVNSTTATKISAVTLTFYFPLSGLTFTATSGSNAGWSNLASNGTTQVVSGVTYYGYSSTYTGTITAKSPNTTLYYGWTSSCTSRSLPSNTFMANSSASVDGKTMTTASGVATIQ